MLQSPGRYAEERFGLSPSTPTAMQVAVASDVAAVAAPVPSPTADAQGQRKRRKKEDSEEASVSAAVPEPRRLRRSHEACTRCRSKKIKCDAKHPSCSACTNANVVCQQEDRYRQTLLERGHTEKIELQLNQCEALLKRYIPSFSLANLDELVRQQHQQEATGPASAVDAGPSYSQEPISPPASAISSGPYYDQSSALLQNNVDPRFDPAAATSYGRPVLPHAETYPIYPHHPQSQQTAHHQFNQAAYAASSEAVYPGQQPQQQQQQQQQNYNQEPVAVFKQDPYAPANDSYRFHGPVSSEEDFLAGMRDDETWRSVQLAPDGRPGLVEYTKPSTPEPTMIYIPRDHKTTEFVIDTYFSYLNIHRPVFTRSAFREEVRKLYTGMTANDPGFLCSFYLILALGTLYIASQAAEQPDSSISMLGTEWPAYRHFFALALQVEPNLRITTSSVQALILLHWYLYTERQGRALWRLVGTLVRLCVELGLHRDPGTYNHGHKLEDEERQLLLRLWSIVLIHDRGTSILLGRPLGIGAADTDAPMTFPPSMDLSEHFHAANAIANSQADVLQFLYTTKPTKDSMIRNAVRISQTMNAHIVRMDPIYAQYLSGHGNVEAITPDQGLTLLKIYITRLLLLRAFFGFSQMSDAELLKVLHAAVITSHNMLVMHQHLIRFHVIAFFVSPIPVHIASVILVYGIICGLNTLGLAETINDVRIALDILPKHRWLWERKDDHGTHRGIATFASRHLGQEIHNITARPHDPRLVEDRLWGAAGFDLENLRIDPALFTGTMGAYGPGGSSTTGMYPGGAAGAHHNHHHAQHYSHHNNPHSHHHHAGSPSLSVAMMPPKKTGIQVLRQTASQLLYPFFPEDDSDGARGDYNPNMDINDIVSATAAAAAGPLYGIQPSQNSYMREEKDPWQGKNYSGGVRHG